MFTVLWCYLRNSDFKIGDTDYHLAADLTGQANHLGVTIEADIIKQKLPENNGGYPAVNGLNGSYGKTHKLVYDKLTTESPIDLTRWQVVNCYLGRAGLINSGGASSGESDLAEAVRTAVINKRAGGMGLISQVAPLGEAATSLVVLIGLAVGVDYCLFYIRRERDERRNGADPHRALVIAAQTSGRSIWVSGPATFRVFLLRA